MWVAIALSLVIVVYNNAANRWRPFHGDAYVPANLAFAGAVALLATTTLDLSPAELGLRADISDALLPLGLLALFALGACGLALSRQGHRIADERVAGMRGGGLAWYVLVRIPIGTALVEELVFRGVLFAVWREAGASDLVTTICASVAFGFWHIQPTLIGLRMNDPLAPRNKVRAAVIGAVLLTTVAGLGLTWLRVWSGGLLGPIVLHAGINSVGALAAVVAGRGVKRSARPDP
jgi:membrane protease YdiL (CAAX protease family)